jgi:hypothetical protein
MKVEEVVRVGTRGYRVSVGKPEEKRLCRRPVREWRVVLKWVVRSYDLRMYVCMYVRAYVRMYYVFTYVHACVCVCVNVCMYIRTCVCLCLYVHM